MKKAIIIVVCLVFLLSLGIYVFQILPNQKSLDVVRNMSIEDIDLNKVGDGSYIGDFTYSSFTYEVEVNVKDHKIEHINIVSNRDTSHAKNAEEIISRVVNQQSLNVDVISGATTTSKALLKAIENALSSSLTTK